MRDGCLQLTPGRTCATTPSTVILSLGMSHTGATYARSALQVAKLACKLPMLTGGLAGEVC
eukprot:5852867-Amphidinium_carterae.1